MSQGKGRRFLAAVRSKMTGPFQGLLNEKRTPRGTADFRTIHEDTILEIPEECPLTILSPRDTVAADKIREETTPRSTQVSNPHSSTLKHAYEYDRCNGLTGFPTQDGLSRDKKADKKGAFRKLLHKLRESGRRQANAILGTHQREFASATASNNGKTCWPNLKEIASTNTPTPLREDTVIDNDFDGIGSSGLFQSSQRIKLSPVKEDDVYHSSRAVASAALISQRQQAPPPTFALKAAEPTDVEHQEEGQVLVQDCECSHDDPDPQDRPPHVQTFATYHSLGSRIDIQSAAVSLVHHHDHDHSRDLREPGSQQSDMRTMPTYRSVGTQTDDQPTHGSVNNSPAQIQAAPSVTLRRSNAIRRSEVMRPTSLSQIKPSPTPKCEPVTLGPVITSSAVSMPASASATLTMDQDPISIVSAIQTQSKQTSPIATGLDTDDFRVKTPLAPRKRGVRSASPTVVVGKSMACTTLVKVAKDLHGRICKVKAAAKGYARGYGLEVTSFKRPYVAMQCSFNDVHGILMVGLSEIISLNTPEAQKAQGVAKSRLIPIKPNPPNPLVSPAQADLNDDGRVFGEHSWIDISVLYYVPADFINTDPYASSTVCTLSLEKIRETLSMGTVAEEILRIEKVIKRYQNTGEKNVPVPDHEIRVRDRIPRYRVQRQPETPPRQRMRPYLRPSDR